MTILSPFIFKTRATEQATFKASSTPVLSLVANASLLLLKRHAHLYHVNGGADAVVATEGDVLVLTRNTSDDAAAGRAFDWGRVGDITPQTQTQATLSQTPTHTDIHTFPCWAKCQASEAQFGPYRPIEPPSTIRKVSSANVTVTLRGVALEVDLVVETYPSGPGGRAYHVVTLAATIGAEQVPGTGAALELRVEPFGNGVVLNGLVDVRHVITDVKPPKPSLRLSISNPLTASS